MASALIVLADGFEEIEAVAVIDILRRAQIETTVAGLDKLKITSARQVKIETDALLDEVTHHVFDVIILPGGEPGTTNLQQSQTLKDLLLKQASQKRLVAAICAAPRILDQIGLLDGKKATSFPGTKPEMKSCDYQEARVVEDGQIITSRGPGTAMEFGFKLVERLKSPQLASSLKEKMLYAG